jgi:Uma2 family endonuclease
MPETYGSGHCAYVSTERAPSQGSPDWKKFPRLAPDLVAEVTSPGQARTELSAKVCFWLRSGARLVRVVWPDEREVDVRRQRSDRPVRTLGAADVLDGEDVLSGFSYPVGRLFE